MFGKIIFHIDVNSAFLSWEAVYRLKILGESLDLREIPSAVGGDIAKRHGIILAKSIPAKKYNIQTGESIHEALNKCPDLTLVQPHYDLYEKSSKAFIEILKEYSPCVEQYSIDEAYCDMTGTGYLFGTPVIAATMMKDRIHRELGFTVNIGISSNKLLAKMAGDFKKPNLVHTLFPGEIEKMWRLPVSELFYVGRSTTKTLLKLGIRTIGELAKADVNVLKSHMKSHGEVIWCYANGIDISVIESQPPANKGYGNSTTIAFDVENSSIAKLVLLSLSETVCTRLRKDNMIASVVSVSIVDFEFKYVSHQMTLFAATNLTNEIHKAACQLFEEIWDGTPIRKLGIHTSRVIENDHTRQLDLFSFDKYEKYGKLDRAIDAIRFRYGEHSIMRATYLNGIKPIGHMGGGVSKEKHKPEGEEVFYR
ncbi:MAG: DNA polymerase IV [Anaerocolumna sp.]